MTVDPTGKNILKISLTHDEVEQIFGGYEHINYSEPRARTALGMLLKHAQASGDFVLDSERLLIEVRPVQGGCVICFTKSEKHSGRRLHRALKSTYVLEFDGIDDMTAGIRELYLSAPALPDSRLYRCENRYRLVIHTAKNIARLLIHMREYCTVTETADALAAATAEYGTAICTKEAVSRIGGAFTDTVRGS